MSKLNQALEQVRHLADTVVTETAERTDRDAAWPEAGIRALQAAGLGGLSIPEEHGGLGLGLSGIVQTCEALGRACSSTALSFGMHLVGAAVLAAKATPDQAKRYLQPIAQGEHLTTLSLSEPGSGSEFYLPQAQLASAPGGYRLTGHKSFVTNGSHADSYVTSAVAAEQSSPVGHFSMLILPGDRPGMTWGPAWSGMGMRGNDSRGLVLEEVEIPSNDLLGDEGDQIWYVFHVVAPFFLAAMSGTYLGVAARALEEARAHIKLRSHTHTGRTLAQSTLIQRDLATLWTTVERTRRFCYWAAEAFDAGDPQGVPAIMSSKVDVATCAVEAVGQAIRLMGGSSYQANSVMDRLLRDAQAAHIMAPTTHFLSAWTGRALLEQPFLSPL